jgi:hypothetical protein
VEKETQNRINYLYLTITKEHNKLIFGICRKPQQIQLYIMIPVTLMNTYLLTQTNKDQEQLLIKEILKKMDINNQLQIINSQITLHKQHQNHKNK